MKTYQETLNFLYTKLPMFSRVGAAAYKTDLHNTVALCNHIGNPQNNFKTIHIAGTNGKGSVSHYLASILQDGGYKVGLYTSPHLVDFRERIKINGVMIAKTAVQNFVVQNEVFINKIEPSFFEVTVALAYEYFSHKKVDVAIIETGLGGRLDSTNIITPLLSVITNIGYDHVALLGNTLAKIAYEKAGIIKPNVPVVIGEFTKETKPVFLAKAKVCNAPILFVSKLHKTIITKATLGTLVLKINEVKVTTPLSGLYQAKNIATVYQAFLLLQKYFFKLTINNFKNGIKQVVTNTGLFGRFQLLQQKPTIIADVAHNPHGITQLVKQIKAIKNTFSKVVFIVGFVNDKDIDACIALLPKWATYICTQAKIPRAINTYDLFVKCNNAGLQTLQATNVNKAINLGKTVVDKKGLIVICGSIFLVGEIEGLTKQKKAPNK